MSDLQKQNYEILLEKLDFIHQCSTGVFSECDFTLHDRDCLAMANGEELVERKEEDPDFAEIWKDSWYIIGFYEQSGENFFVDLNENTSTIYMFSDDNEVINYGTIDNYKDFVIECQETLNSDCEDKLDKAQELLSKHLGDSGIETILDSWLEEVI